MAAILMLVFVGSAAITAMSTLFIHEAKRTHIAVAGAGSASSSSPPNPAAAKNSPATPPPTTSPSPRLSNATLTLQIQSTPDTATIRTIAHLTGGAGSTATSTTIYTHTQNGWTLQSATLTGL